MLQKSVSVIGSTGTNYVQIIFKCQYSVVSNQISEVGINCQLKQHICQYLKCFEINTDCQFTKQQLLTLISAIFVSLLKHSRTKSEIAIQQIPASHCYLITVLHAVNIATRMYIQSYHIFTHMHTITLQLHSYTQILVLCKYSKF